ncbi:MAG: ATP-binding protein [Clostridiales bacterium]|nr:ATP-binding protein [Clostridiales bacterium]
MGYSEHIYSSAMKELQSRKNRAESEQKARHDEAAEKIPELIEIERIMASAGLEVVKAIGMGADANEFIENLAKKNLAAQKKRAELLKAAGYPDDWLKVKYTCPICRDTGFTHGRICRCHKELLRSLAYKELSDSVHIEKYTFDNFNLEYYPKNIDTKTGISPYERMSEIFEYCKNYAEDFGTDSDSLLMFGETGLGKTHLSLAIAGVAVTKGYGVIYGSAQNIFNRIENEHFGKETNESDTVQSLIDCDLLIIDDLGAEFVTQFTKSILYNIINMRLQSGLPVIISTNLTPEGLEKNYERRITSRIFGEYVTFAFCGSDIRQLKNL